MEQGGQVRGRQAGLIWEGSSQASGGPVSAAFMEDLVVGNRILAIEGVLDAYGHVSMRHPTDPNRYLLSRSLAPELVTADDILEYDLNSNPVDAKGRASVLERFIHGEIYKVRADVRAVIHSHSPAVIPFGITQHPLRPVYHQSAFLHGGVPVWDIRDVRDPDAAAMLVRNGALGNALASAVRRRIRSGPIVLRLLLLTDRAYEANASSRHGLDQTLCFTAVADRATDRIDAGCQRRF